MDAKIKKTGVTPNILATSHNNLHPDMEKTTEAARKAEDIGKQAFEEAKDATLKAGEALKALFADPTTGQARAISSLGPKGTLQTGVVFLTVFVLSTFVGSFLVVKRVFGGLGELGGGFQTRMVISSLLGAVLTAAAFAVSIWTVAHLFGNRKLNWRETMFSTGVCLAPMSVAFLIGTVLAILNLYTPLMGVFLVALSMLILCLNALLTSLAGVSERLSFLLTPAVLLITAVLIYLVR